MVKELTGGRAGAIYQKGTKVYRPLNPWSLSVHKLLRFLQDNHFYQSPSVVAITKDQEILSYVAGDTGNYPLQGSLATLPALASAARLLRQFHDLSAKFVKSVPLEKEIWMLPKQMPVEVVCHGDFAPYNVALTGNQVTGLFDFDTAHPATRLWDVAYAVYCWAPFKTNEDDKLGELPEQCERARAFCDAYQLSQESRERLPAMMVKRLNALLVFMKERAEEGDLQFQKNIEEGHHLNYLADIEFIEENSKTIIRTIIGNE